ncbi:hypothetical protein GUJ93_ZPchr0006g44392 [Zizania palustris]|uniref:Uncharacterized protein n=1 Tax=Zizania palustris TaxID=103762 RepID=A0A8J5W1G7_ZIZPA|nr:hypothetical protein GUJ93_ZPchr0006g44392 [Zizania palustris]
MALPSQAALGSRSFPDRRVHMETLDLNSHGEGFPFVDSYSSYLQQGVPHLGPSGDGGRIAAFQPPRPINTGAGSGRGRSLAMRGSRSRAVNNGAGSSSQPRVNAPGVHIGSPPQVSATGLGSRGRGRTTPNHTAEDIVIQDDVEDEADNSSQMRRAECKKFRSAIPAYIDFLHEMFHGAAVDGRTSCIPGVDGNGDENIADDEGGVDGTQLSPLSTNSRKRGI